MNDKELKKLSRTELLELLLEASEENEKLKTENARLSGEIKDAEKQISDRKLELTETGSIAEASLKLSGIFEAAQNAASIYLDNIKTVDSETKTRSDAKIAETEAKCAELIGSAKAEADRLTRESNEKTAAAEKAREDIVEDAKRQTETVWGMLKQRMDKYCEAHSELQNELKNLSLGNYRIGSITGDNNPDGGVSGGEQQK